MTENPYLFDRLLIASFDGWQNLRLEDGRWIGDVNGLIKGMEVPDYKNNYFEILGVIARFNFNLKSQFIKNLSSLVNLEETFDLINKGLQCVEQNKIYEAAIKTIKP